MQLPAATKTYKPKKDKNWRQWEKDNPGYELEHDPDDDPNVPIDPAVLIVLGFDPDKDADIEANSAKGKAKRKREIDGGLGCPACETKWTKHDVDEENLALGDKCPECGKADLVPLRNIIGPTGS